MKQIFTSLTVLLISCMGFAASHTDTFNCKSELQDINFDVSFTYSEIFLESATANFNGVPLKLAKTKLFTVLEGNTDGDMDNYQTYQLTMINRGKESAERRFGLLIIEDHVARIGFETKVIDLTCILQK